MIFEGDTLQQILGKQGHPVSIFDGHGVYRGGVRPCEGAELAAEYGLVGIGRRNRIYNLQPGAHRPRLNPDPERCGRNPTALRMPVPVTKNVTAPGALGWKGRPDKAQTGTFGDQRTIFRRHTI